MSLQGLLMSGKDQHMPWWCHQCPAAPSELFTWFNVDQVLESSAPPLLVRFQLCSVKLAMQDVQRAIEAIQMPLTQHMLKDPCVAMEHAVVSIPAPLALHPPA